MVTRPTSLTPCTYIFPPSDLWRRKGHSGEFSLLDDLLEPCLESRVPVYPGSLASNLEYS